MSLDRVIEIGTVSQLYEILWFYTPLNLIDFKVSFYVILKCRPFLESLLN